MRGPIIVVAVGVGACGGDAVGPDGLSPAQLEQLGARLSIAMLAAAAGDQGSGLFDNFIPCPRRGVLDYSNSAAGRRVGFSGCDLGDRIVVTGGGELRWVGSGLADVRTPFCTVAGPAPSCESALRWEGRLTVAVEGDTVVLETFAVDDLEMRADGARFPDDLRIETADLGLVRLRATVREVGIPVTDPSVLDAVFNPALTPNALANAGNDLARLTDADLKRIAFQAALELASLLVNETLETQRGDHTHDLECGTVAVTIVDQLPVVANTWSSCEAGGTFFTGQFTLSWDGFDARGGPLSMVSDGPLTLGGGLPTITLQSLSWVAEGVEPDRVRISGLLETASGSRRYDFTVFADD